MLFTLYSVFNHLVRVWVKKYIFSLFSPIWEEQYRFNPLWDKGFALEH